MEQKHNQEVAEMIFHTKKINVTDKQLEYMKIILEGCLHDSIDSVKVGESILSMDELEDLQKKIDRW